jgi:DNA-binding response OmpR family regulator
MTVDWKTLRHDLRTPFNAILNYAEMLLEEEPEQGQPELNQLLGEAKVLLQQVTNQLGDEAPNLDRAAELLTASLPRLRAPLARLDAARFGEDLARLHAAVDALERLTAERLLSCPWPPPAVSETHAPVESVAALPRPAAETGPRFLGPRAVLVVDDQESNRDLLCRRLEREGHHPTAATGGLHALECLQRGSFDLVLLDLLMPDLSGYEVLARMKADAYLREVPVIVISALDELESVVRCIEMGAEDYLPKPFDPVLLRARVGACLEKKHLRDKELAYFRAVRELETAAAAVEKGRFDRASLDEVAGREDELGQLARVFQRMAGEVKAREERLEQQVRELRISIDQDRKAREVAAITGSSIFEALEKKAEELRSRRRD